MLHSVSTSLILISLIVHHVFSFSIGEFNYTLSKDWLLNHIDNTVFGDVAGVDVDKDNNVYIFHRGSHKWGQDTFNYRDEYQGPDSPIPENTVVKISPQGEILKAWGAGKFYMPHGLSLDLEEKHVWLTDVALHQIFKYTIEGKHVLTVGQEFVNGRDEKHFCKPTSVADAGDYIFVADGYCNHRIIIRSSTDGDYIGEFGHDGGVDKPPNMPSFNIPHKVIFAKQSDLLCVADRENGRIQCFTFTPKHVKKDQSNEVYTNQASILNRAITDKFIIADPSYYGKLFSIDYSPIRGGILVAVSGLSQHSETRKWLEPTGFVYNVSTGQLISKFTPNNGKKFGMAHDLAVTFCNAKSIYVADIGPANLWQFNRPIPELVTPKPAAFRQIATQSFDKAMSMIHNNGQHSGLIWYFIFLAAIATIVFFTMRSGTRSTSYSSNYPTSIKSLFGNPRFHRKFPVGSSRLFNNTFSRSRLFNLFSRDQQQSNDFSQLPLDDSDNSDEDKSDSDVEEFNINNAAKSCRIDV